MEDRHTSQLLETALVGVYDVCCHAPRSGPGPIELTTVTQIVLPRRGVFVVERHGDPVAVDTTTAFVFAAGDEYVVSHPGSDGDDCTVVVLPPDVHEDALGPVASATGRLQPRDHLLVCGVTSSLRQRSADELEGVEAALLLVSSAARALAGEKARIPELAPVQRRRVAQVRALLAAAPGVRWDLQSLAGAVSCSPFHLARQFRLATGETISRYLLRLRLDLALERLAGGEANLSALAVETGFAHHSHFSARFRAAFGLTPSDARETLTRPRLDRLRALAGSARS